MRLAAAGMLAAVIGTLLNHEIISFTWIIIGLVVGGAIGAAISIWMPMTAMPQRIGHLARLRALAADAGRRRALLSIYWTCSTASRGPTMARPGLRGPLRLADHHRQLHGIRKAARFRPQPADHIQASRTLEHRPFSDRRLPCSFRLSSPHQTRRHHWLFYLMVAIGVVVGVLLVLPIGGADMPVVISLLNSYAGLASAATGFAHRQQRADHRRGAGRGLRLHPLDPDEQGDEPLVRQRALRRLGGAGAGRRLPMLEGKTVRARDGRRRGDSVGLRPQRDRDSGLRHGGRPGSARGSRTGGAARGAAAAR